MEKETVRGTVSAGGEIKRPLKTTTGQETFKKKRPASPQLCFRCLGLRGPVFMDGWTPRPQPTCLGCEEKSNMQKRLFFFCPRTQTMEESLIQSLCDN